MRLCRKCGIEKTEDQFYTHKDAIHRYYCKNCHLIRTYWHLYKLTPEMYFSLKEKQSNKCALCKQEKKLNVDHDHKTGKVRGLLCSRCNTFLGHIELDPSLIENARSYLNEHVV